MFCALHINASDRRYEFYTGKVEIFLLRQFWYFHSTVHQRTASSKFVKFFSVWLIFTAINFWGSHTALLIFLVIYDLWKLSNYTGYFIWCLYNNSAARTINCLWMLSKDSNSAGHKKICTYMIYYGWNIPELVALRYYRILIFTSKLFVQKAYDQITVKVYLYPEGKFQFHTDTMNKFNCFGANSLE